MVPSSPVREILDIKSGWAELDSLLRRKPKRRDDTCAVIGVAIVAGIPPIRIAPGLTEPSSLMATKDEIGEIL